ncbi:hypothetical protein BKA81DRAFT_166996 [Phyllosticta paracitricarpa]
MVEAGAADKVRKTTSKVAFGCSDEALHLGKQKRKNQKKGRERMADIDFWFFFFFFCFFFFLESWWSPIAAATPTFSTFTTTITTTPQILVCVRVRVVRLVCCYLCIVYNKRWEKGGNTCERFHLSEPSRACITSLFNVVIFCPCLQA